MLYVEGEWDTISEQHDVDSCFEQGDTITVCLEPLSRDTSPGAARKVWYLKRSQNAKAAEFSPDGKGELLDLMDLTQGLTERTVYQIRSRCYLRIDSTRGKYIRVSGWM